MTRRLSVLLDKQEIHEATLRYCRGVDRLDRDLIRSAYHDDAVDHHGGYSGPVEVVIARLLDRLSSCYESTTHLIGNQLIDVEGNEADAETYFVAFHILRQDIPDLEMIGGTRVCHLTVLGRYVDRFTRRNYTWRITSRTVVFDSIQTGSSRATVPEAIRNTAVFGSRDLSDPSYRPMLVKDRRAGDRASTPKRPIGDNG